MYITFLLVMKHFFLSVPEPLQSENLVKKKWLNFDQMINFFTERYFCRFLNTGFFFTGKVYNEGLESSMKIISKWINKRT